MTALLPECMMPEVADPCAAFTILQDKVESQNAEIERLRADFEAMKTWALDSDNTNDRLRAALQKIAEFERGGCLGSDADEIIDIARDAISAHEQGAPPACAHAPMKNALDDGVSCIRCGADLGSQKQSSPRHLSSPSLPSDPRSNP